MSRRDQAKRANQKALEEKKSPLMPKIRSTKTLTITRQARETVHDSVILQIMDQPQRRVKTYILELFILMYYTIYNFSMLFFSFILLFALQKQDGDDAGLHQWYQLQQVIYLSTSVLTYIIARNTMKFRHKQFKVRICSSKLEISVPLVIRHIILIIAIELFNIAFGAYALWEYFYNLSDFQNSIMASDYQVLYLVPIVAFVDVLYIVRLGFFAFIFILLPIRSRKQEIEKKIKNKIENKFPVLTLKGYLKQTQQSRFSLDALNEDVNCAICCEEIKMEDEIVVLSCNVKHFFNKDCIQVWLEKNNSCPLCKAEIIEGLVLNPNNP